MDELFFRICLSIIFFAFIAIWLRSFFLTGFKKSSYYTMKEGLLAGLAFRFFLTISIFSILAYLFDPEFMAWSGLALATYLKVPGIPLGVLGICILLWSIQSLGKNFYATLKLRKNHKLITGGPYRYARHPMYVSFVLMWISFFLLSSNWFICLTGILTYIIIFLWRVPREEEMLSERFGEEFDDYKKQS